MTRTRSQKLNSKKPWRTPAKPKHGRRRLRLQPKSNVRLASTRPKYYCQALVDWCEPHGQQQRLVEELQVSRALVSRWVSGHLRVSAENCLKIEKATGGAVQPWELRPDIEWPKSIFK